MDVGHGRDHRKGAKKSGQSLPVEIAEVLPVNGDENAGYQHHNQGDREHRLLFEKMNQAVFYILKDVSFFRTVSNIMVFDSSIQDASHVILFSSIKYEEILYQI